MSISGIGNGSSLSAPQSSAEESKQPRLGSVRPHRASGYGTSRHDSLSGYRFSQVARPIFTPNEYVLRLGGGSFLAIDTQALHSYKLLESLEVLLEKYEESIQQLSKIDLDKFGVRQEKKKLAKMARQLKYAAYAYDDKQGELLGSKRLDMGAKQGNWDSDICLLNLFTQMWSSGKFSIEELVPFIKLFNDKQIKAQAYIQILDQLGSDKLVLVQSIQKFTSGLSPSREKMLLYSYLAEYYFKFEDGTTGLDMASKIRSATRTPSQVHMGDDPDWLLANLHRKVIRNEMLRVGEVSPEMSVRLVSLIELIDDTQKARVFKVPPSNGQCVIC